MGLEDPEVISVTAADTTSNSLLCNSRCCFIFPCFSSRRSSAVGISWWQRIRLSQGHTSPEESSRKWWSRGVRVLKKIREWSEIVAGPRWKTFIRKFNTRQSRGHHGKFQYDPLSYSLNFDQGHSFELDDDDYNGFRDFSSRYAYSASASGKPLAMAVSSGVVAETTP